MLCRLLLEEVALRRVSWGPSGREGRVMENAMGERTGFYTLAAGG